MINKLINKYPSLLHSLTPSFLRVLNVSFVRLFIDCFFLLPSLIYLRCYLPTEATNQSKHPR